MTFTGQSPARRIVFCGGGSGGHLTPSIAVAKRLKENAEFLFCASSRPVDRQILEQAVLPAKTQLLFQPLSSSRSRVAYGWRLCHSVVVCLKAFRRFRPDVVVGTGGFASVPGLIAARILNLPIVLFEPNAVPGKANRLFASFSRTTLVGMPWSEDRQQKWKSPLVRVGIPIRELPDAQPKRRQLFVIGGSLGAHRLNEIVSAAVSSLADLLNAQGYEVLHQSGPQQHEELQRKYDAAKVPCRVTPFVEDSLTEMMNSRLVITRAGAVTLAEINATNVDAICVPLSTSADDHQLENAKAFANQTGATVIDETADDAVQQITQAITERLTTEQNIRATTTNSDPATDLFAQQIMEIAQVK